ncbi:MAG: hypothetical protein IPM42_01360 [Saprospiraceae bacterium]|nr:hypothetical protein [Saprospiraceae bacterium]
MNLVVHENESYFKISNHDHMRPFFMNIVSDSNHWMFISSNGGITAGRKNPEFALFPYYTEDKLTEFADITGSKTIFKVYIEGEILIWEPFSERFFDKYKIRRNLYKNLYGNKIMFEEVNHDLGLIFRYAWNTGNEFGFVKKSELINISKQDCHLTLLDGIQNVMPYGVASDLQMSTSNLADAYKRSELHASTGAGIFALSAIIVDKAEPSEALKANVVWSLGLEDITYLLSSLQLNAFRKKQNLISESDIKGEKGGYFVSTDLNLPAGSEKHWKIIANVNQSQSQIIGLCQTIGENKSLNQKIEADINIGTQNLIQLTAAADALQCTADHLKDSRHYANVLFNIMRGGIFDDNFQTEKADFVSYLINANKEIFNTNKEFINGLPDVFSLSYLRKRLSNSEDVDLIRLSTEYLPLKFSRRHGDPSRPWNKFSINTQNESDGSKVLDYEGNWRDIFQNWEALAYAYPEFIEGMICKFLNASTFDGYNPYRVTKGGFDWETIEPDNPWSYIGYWGDHQIIYLLKFLEFIEKHHPGRLNSYFDKEYFVYAAVPYIIKPYEQILQNPKDTIEFDHEWDSKIRTQRELTGADGALLTMATDTQEIYHVNLIEKLLATILAKISNFIPEGGIWMNTQRPEWNDANNALVGNGVSMVTLCYLRRFMKFFQVLADASDIENIKISSELIEFYHSVRESLLAFKPLLTSNISDKNKKELLDSLGKAASDYRSHVYQGGFWGKKRSISMDGLRRFAKLSLEVIEHSIKANRRSDNLYHAYNLMTATDSEVSVSHLSEMLEGQVAVLSSGYLSSEEALDVLDALKNSSLFRKDQYSYILYPNKDLPGFLEKNNISKVDAESLELIRELMKDGNQQIVERDILGNYHFNGNLKNAGDLENALNLLSVTKYKLLVENDKTKLLNIFEKVFHHKAFTGRSGTFFAYEGLGSIYWHMVSKLHVAVQECCLKAINENADAKVTGQLLEHYYEIYEGIGIHKSPELYGAFPTDPYSHTPMHRGAQQPGMTGQVKEDILVRFGELGVFVQDGKIFFNPVLLRKEEFLTESKVCEYVNIRNEKIQILLEPDSICFTYCQVPVIYKLDGKDGLEIIFADGRSIFKETLELEKAISQDVFGRTGNVRQINVSILKTHLINGK